MVKNVERLVLFVGDGFDTNKIFAGSAIIVQASARFCSRKIIWSTARQVFGTPSPLRVKDKDLLSFPSLSNKNTLAFPHRNGYHSRALVVSAPPIHPKAKAPPRPRELPKRQDETRKAQTWRHFQRRRCRVQLRCKRKATRLSRNGCQVR